MRIKVDKLPETCHACTFFLADRIYSTWENEDYCIVQHKLLSKHRTRDEKCPLEVCDMKCQPINYLDTSAFYNTNRMPFIGKMWKTVKEIE